MEGKRLFRLVKRARSGDQEAFREIIEIKGRKILYTATKLMGNVSDGEDAAQEAVIKMGQSLPKLRRAESLDSWMYRIVYNVCMDAKKTSAKGLGNVTDLDEAAEALPDFDTEVLPEQIIENEAIREVLLSAINKLPERYRLCLVLYYYEDLSYVEIAAALQVNEHLVGTLLKRARVKLRAELHETGDPSITEYLKKPGGVLPAAAIAQVLTFEEQEVVTADMLDKLVAVAASDAAALPGKAIFLSLLSTLLASGIARTAAVVLVVSALSVLGFTALSNASGAAEKNTDPDGVSDTSGQKNVGSGVSSHDPSGIGFETFPGGSWSPEDWEKFVEEEGLEYIRHIVGTEYRFNLYTYHNQATGGNQAIIARIDIQGNTQAVSKNLSDGEPLPSGYELVSAFERWR